MFLAHLDLCRCLSIQISDSQNRANECHDHVSTCNLAGPLDAQNRRLHMIYQWYVLGISFQCLWPTQIQRFADLLDCRLFLVFIDGTKGVEGKPRGLRAPTSK